MSKTTDERKERLRKRTRRGVDERGQRGLGKRVLLDLTKANGKVVSYKMEAERGKKRLIDILPFIITQPWYRDLRTKSGTPTGLEVGDWDYKLEIPIHSNVGDDNLTFICLQQAFGKKCSECEDLYAEWDKDEKDQDEKKIDSLKTSWRDCYNVYDYDGESGGIELWDDQAYFNFEDMLIEAMEVDDEGLATFWDLENGRSIEYKTREKKLGRNTFHKAHSIVFHKRDRYEESILEKVHPLDVMLIIPTYEEVVKARLGSDDGTRQPEEELHVKSGPEQTGRRRPDTAAKEEATDASSPKCPSVSGTFGKDCNQLKDCESCDENLFKACGEETGQAGKEVETAQPVRRRRNI